MSFLSPITEKLLPDSNGTISGWSTTSGGGAYVDVDADDTNYVTSTSVGSTFIVGFENLSVSSGVTINWIKAYNIIFLNSPDRSHAIDIKMELKLADGTGVDGTTHSNVINKWITEVNLFANVTSITDISAINGLQVLTTYSAQNAAGIEANVDHIFLQVNYTPSVETYDDTLNNITMTSGTSTLTEGTIILN